MKIRDDIEKENKERREEKRAAEVFFEVRESSTNVPQSVEQHPSRHHPRIDTPSHEQRAEKCEQR
jgi:hypothetical protein